MITGATRGLGRIIAEHFLSLGYNVAICSKSKDSCRQIETLFSKWGKNLFVSQADVAAEKQMAEWVEKTAAKFGKIDVLINNAGIYGPVGKIFQNDSAAWIETMAVNCFGIFYACKHVIPHMIQKKFGRIINLSGGGATTPMPGYSAYSTSKAAVVRLTETMALELKEHGITVNAIAPGFIATDIHHATLKAGENAAGPFYQKTAEKMAAGGDDPMYAAKLAAFLASGDCRITGKLISAVFDNWNQFQSIDLHKDLYTLRRIDNCFFGEYKNA